MGAGGGECGLCVNEVMNFREWPLGWSPRYAPCQQRPEGRVVMPSCLLQTGGPLGALSGRGHLLGSGATRGTVMFGGARGRLRESDDP